MVNINPRDKVIITNKKKISIALISIIILTAFTAGCSGDDGKPKVKINYEEQTGDRTLSGWADYDQDTGSGGISTLEETFEMNLNSSMLTSVTVKITCEDSDDAHAETDEGSDPDDFTVVINSTGFESQPMSGSTPATLTLTIPAANATAANPDEQIQFGPELTIRITATCGGGKEAYLFRPGLVIQASPLVYIDQGLAYSITIQYNYLEVTGGEINL